MLVISLLMMVSVVQIHSAQTDVCSADSVVKLSKFFGITIKRAELGRRYQEQSVALAEIEKDFNAAVQEYEEIELQIKNLSSIDIQETQISQKCVPNDCCEVYECDVIHKMYV